jgi:hypothetical protein
MLCAAGFGIAFDAPPRVRETAHALVDGGDLRGILPLVARHLDGNRHYAEVLSQSAEPLYGEWP